MHMFKNLIRRAIVSLLTDDKGTYPLIQVKYNDIVSDALRLSPYGVCSNPPEKSIAYLLAPFNRVDEPAAIMDDVVNRFKELKEGEVQLGNYITRSSMKFLEDGSVSLTLPNGGDYILSVDDGQLSVDVPGDQGITINSGGNVDLTAPVVNIDGDLTVTGTVTGQTEVVGGVSNVRLSAHQHVISGGSSAGTTASTVP